jgi:hypothetical protein
VSVIVGRGVEVIVGRGVLVKVGGGGLGVAVRLAALTTVTGVRTLLVRVGVIVTKRLCVSVGCAVRDAGAGVPLGLSVSVGTKTVTICSVSAAAVPKLETAKSRILIGSSVMGI